MDLLIFGELVSSNDFLLLLLRNLSLFSNAFGLGNYLQGIPVSPFADFTWGTNAGIRTVPILLFLTVIQKLFPRYWLDIYASITFCLPFLGFYFALRMLGKNYFFILVGSILYGLNPWIIDRFFTGFWQLNIVYSLLPFLIVIPIKIVESRRISFKENLFYGSLFAFFASIILVAQPHFLIMAGLFIMYYLAYTLLFHGLRSFLLLISSLCIGLGIFFLCTFYYFIPGIFYPENTYTASKQYFSLASVRLNGSDNSLSNIVRFASYSINLKSEFAHLQYLQFLPLLLVVLFFLLSKKRQYFPIFFIIIFLFLAKGLNPPFENVSYWAYNNIVLLHFFRDPSRFLAGVALFASLSISFTELRWKLQKDHIPVFLSILLAAFILLNGKKFSQSGKTVLQKTVVPEQYTKMQAYIASNLSSEKNTRLLTLPNAHGFKGYPWYENESPVSANTAFESVIPLSIPLANSTNYPDNFGNQISSFIYNEFVKSYDGRLLQSLGVSYILLDNSIREPESEKRIAENSEQQLLNNGFTLLHREGTLLLLKSPYPSSIINTKDPIFAIGTFKTISELSKSFQNPIILINQQYNFQILSQSLLRHKTLIVDTKNPRLTLTGELLGKQFAVDILEAGWDYDRLFSNFEPYKMAQVNETGNIYTSGRSVNTYLIKEPMDIPHVLLPGEYQVLLKAASENNKGLVLEVEGKKIKVPLPLNTNLTWIDSGSITINEKQQSVRLSTNESGRIFVDYLLLVPKDIYKKKVQEVTLFLNKTKLISVKEATVSAIRAPSNIADSTTLLVNYGTYWQEKKSGLPLMSNGYGMTFINRKISDKITYRPDILYRLLIIISLGSYIGVLYVILTKYRKSEIKKT